MRINTAGEEPISSEIIIHGKKPKSPDRSCKNCSKKLDCKILQYSLTTLGAIDFLPKTDGAFSEYADIPIPMPCRGSDWQSTARISEIHDPLVQRLGLSGIGEPISGAAPQYRPKEDHQ